VSGSDPGQRSSIKTQPALFERNESAATDYNVIEDIDIQQFAGLNDLVSYLNIFRRRCGVA
jgi:hypothetical protein